MKYGKFGKINTGSKILDVAIWLFCFGYLVYAISWVADIFINCSDWFKKTFKKKKKIKPKEVDRIFKSDTSQDLWNTDDLFKQLNKMTEKRKEEEFKKVLDLLDKVCNKRMTLYTEEKIFLERKLNKSIEEIEKYTYTGVDENGKIQLVKRQI